MDLELARKRLQDVLADLDRSVATLRGEYPPDGAAELAGYDQHPADSASNLSDADRTQALLEVSERRRSLVQEALERIDAGTYGACVVCGRSLPEERLEARPEAARCVQCQEQLESGG